MDEFYDDIIGFIRELIFSDSPRDIRERALDILLKESGGKKEISRGIYILKSQYDKILTYLDNDKKIAAIKELRNVADLTLKQSHEIIDDIEEREKDKKSEE